MNFLSLGWLWIYAGAALMFMELLTPGFIVFFFGLAAATVGALVLLLPEGFSLGLTGQLALFSFLSILYLVTLRRYARGFFGGDKSAENDIDADFAGRIGQVTEAIVPPAEGRVTVGDAAWTAVADVPLAVGTRVKVVSRNNLTLTVVSAN